VNGLYFEQDQDDDNNNKTNNISCKKRASRKIGSAI